MEEIVIAWDVDDVLNNFMQAWLSWVKVFYPEKRFPSYQRLTQNPPCELCNMTREEYLKSLDEFRENYYNTPVIMPNPKVLVWFEKFGFEVNGKRLFHICITAIPLKFAGLSADWVFKNFGKWIRGFFSVPSEREEDESFPILREKSGVFKHFKKVDIFIDDREENVEKGKKFAKKSLLFPAPWNKNRGLEVSKFLKKLTRHIEIIAEGDKEDGKG